MPTPKLNILQGTLDLLILCTLRLGSMHGWAIAASIQEMTDGALEVTQGSLYPALHRLEQLRWIHAEWGVSGLGRRARFYRLTARGRQQAEAENEQWRRLTGAINRVVDATE